MKIRSHTRHLRYSIGFKFGLFVAVILISAMFLVGIFIVKLQKNTREGDLKRNLQSYLFSYKNAALKFLEDKENIKALQGYTKGLKSIPNFKNAMFVDPRGRVFAHSRWHRGRFDGSRLIRKMPVPKLTGTKFRKKYPNIGYFLSSVVDDSSAYFIRSAKYTEAEYQKLITRVNKKNSKRLKRNKKARLLNYPSNTSYFEGFLPVYQNPFKRINRNDVSLKKAMSLFQKWKKEGFNFSGKQQGSRIKDLKFISMFEYIYKLLFVEEKDEDGEVLSKELTNYAKRLLKLKKYKLGLGDISIFSRYINLLKQYRNGFYSVNSRRYFNRSFLKRVSVIIDSIYRKRVPKAFSKVIKNIKNDELFRNSIDKKDSFEIKTAVAYLENAELFLNRKDEKRQQIINNLIYKRYISPFLKGDETLVDLHFFRNRFKNYLKTGRFTFPKLYRYRKLKKIYRPLISKEDKKAFFRHGLRILVSPYKIGFVRIILSPKSIEKEMNLVVINTIDLSLSLVLRLIFISFLLSGLMIKNVRILTEGAIAVGKGDFKNKIVLNTSDELGQLADEFNVMTANIRKAQGQLVEKARMEEELKIAEQIQSALLPKKLPEIPGFEFAAYYSAQTEAGGDYYDFIDVGKDYIGIAIADVSGHGVGSGLVMSMVRTVLRSHAPGTADARDVLCRINPFVYQDTLPAMFATVFYGTINYKNKKMFYASAGHNPAVLYKEKKGEAQLLPSGGVPLGMTGSESFDPLIELRTLQLEKGDVVLLYTDGVTEVMNSQQEEFQEERLIAAVKKYASGSPDDLINGIVKEVSKFTASMPQEDDITMLALKILG